MDDGKTVAIHRHIPQHLEGVVSVVGQALIHHCPDWVLRGDYSVGRTQQSAYPPYFSRGIIRLSKRRVPFYHP